MATILSPYSPTITFTLFTPLILSIYYIFFVPRIKFLQNSPKQTSEQYPVVGALGYFSEKWDFYHRSSAASPSKSFSFYLGKHAVVGLGGETGREAFFNSRQLGISQGVPGPPELPAVFGEFISLENKEFHPSFIKWMHSIFTTERFSQDLPVLIRDAKDRLRKLTKEAPSIINPFDVLYEMIFQFTVREVCCNDIADNPVLLDKLTRLFKTAETSFNPRIILFPSLFKLLSLAWWKQIIASIRMYVMLKGVIDQRKKGGKRDDDPVQRLVDRGEADATIVQLMLGALFAGIDNSGKNAAWNLIYLAINPHWKEQALYEVRRAAADSPTKTHESLVERLSALPLEAWETEFPFLDMVLRETIRLHLQGVQFRKNVSGTDAKVGDEVIPAGAYALYHNADIHLDPQVYPDPHKWNPSRHSSEEAQGKRKKMDFIGWGAGRHNCAGIRFAKLESTIVMALFLAMYDFELCDAEGKSVTRGPKFNANNQNTSRPDKPAFLRIWPRQEGD